MNGYFYRILCILIVVLTFMQSPQIEVSSSLLEEMLQRMEEEKCCFSRKPRAI